MAVGSFIEMFMTTFGWHLYGIVWGVLSSTGLAYLPLLYVIFKNIVQPIESQDAKSASVTSLRRLELDVVKMVVVLMLAASPSFTINFGAITHAKSCEGEIYSQGRTGTVFDGLLSDTVIGGQSVSAPPLFYLLMSVIGGVNQAIIASLPCELDVRHLQFQATTTQILDPQLRRETQTFVTECYEYARADFFNNSRQLPDDMSSADINWIGSQYFNDNYYKTHYSINPVPSFEFERSRKSDALHYVEGQLLPESGYPSCWEWWNDPQSGIRAGLLEQLELGMLETAKIYFTQQTKEDVENSAIRQLITNEGSVIMDGLDLGQSPMRDLISADSFSDVFDAVEDTGSLVVASVGAGITQALIKPATYFIKEGAPYIQAALLFAIYFLLPFILIIGNYQVKTVITVMVTICTVKLWTMIWAVIDLLDSKLAGAIRDLSGFDGAGLFTPNNLFLTTIIDLMILTMYIGIPTYFLSMLAWAGQGEASVGAGEQSQSMSKGHQSAGDRGANSSGNAVGSAVGRLKG